MLKLVFTALPIVALAGCATALTSHNPSGAALAELAIVAVEDQGVWLGDYEIQGSIEGALNSSGVIVIRPDMFTNTRGDFSLQQGAYRFIVRCKSRGVYNDHRIEIDLKPGERYVAYCLGYYRDGLLGDRLTGILGFVSNIKELAKDKVRNQAILEREVIDK